MSSPLLLLTQFCLATDSPRMRFRNLETSPASLSLIWAPTLRASTSIRPIRIRDSCQTKFTQFFLQRIKRSGLDSYLNKISTLIAGGGINRHQDITLSCVRNEHLDIKTKGIQCTCIYVDNLKNYRWFTCITARKSCSVYLSETEFILIWGRIFLCKKGKREQSSLNHIMNT